MKVVDNLLEDGFLHDVCACELGKLAERQDQAEVTAEMRWKRFVELTNSIMARVNLCRLLSKLLGCFIN